MSSGLGDLQTTVAPHGSLSDLDVTLRGLLADGLAGVGISSVAITFDAPERDRVATWPSPAVNLFLYDLRESDHPRDRSWMRTASQDGGSLDRAPLRLDCSYAITAWTREVLDEHRLLSQVLAILLAHPELTPDLLEAGLKVGAPPASLAAQIAHAGPQDRADFWTAVGSPHKAALEYCVTVLVEPGLRRGRGAATSGTGLAMPYGPTARQDGAQLPGAATLSQGGTVIDAAGRPAKGAWVLLPAAGRSAVVSDAGRFVVSGIVAGSYEFRARAVDGTTASVTASVPGPPVAIVVGG
jgi:hypothetical protein